MNVQLQDQRKHFQQKRVMKTNRILLREFVVYTSGYIVRELTEAGLLLRLENNKHAIKKGQKATVISKLKSFSHSHPHHFTQDGRHLIETTTIS